MHIYEIIVLAVILVAALMDERINNVIHPVVWIVGGIAEIVIKYKYDTKISWMEGVAALVIVFVTILIVARRLGNAVGGGIYKGILMCSFYFGRGTIIFIPLFIIFLIIVIKIKGKTVPIYAMPYMFISYLITVATMMLVI